MPENGRGLQSPTRRPPPEPEAIGLTVLYEDEWLIAIDKPSGMVVHPTYRNWSGTLLNALLWHVSAAPAARPPALQLSHGHAAEGRASAGARSRRGRPSGDPGVPQPRIVTRLDRDTSGIVLVALTSDVHKRIQRDALARRVIKSYLAIVRGTPVPPRGSIELPLARSVEDRRRVVVDGAGRPSHTKYELLSAAGGYAVLCCEPVTGRTHQIRVHLAARGWPVAGDRVYGAADEQLPRQALHAWRATLPHPITREPLEVEAPLPPDLRQLLRDQNLTL